MRDPEQYAFEKMWPDIRIASAVVTVGDNVIWFTEFFEYETWRPAVCGFKFVRRKGS